MSTDNDSQQSDECEETRRQKSIIFLWGVDRNSGKPYIDSFVEISGGDKIKNSLRIKNSKLDIDLNCLSLRSRYASDTKMALFHVPESMTIDDLLSYLQNEEIEVVLKRLNEGKFSL